MSTYDDASLIMFPSGYKEDKIYSLKPTDGSGDLTFTRASTATRVNSDGLIETSPVNLFEYSEQFDNAIWAKDAGNTIAANSTTAPNGTTTADTISATAGSVANVSQLITTTEGVYTYSIYLKKNATNLMSTYIYLIGTGFVASGEVNFDNGTYTTSSGTGAIENLGNGWFRILLTQTLSAGVNSFGIINLSTTGTRTVYAWGAQLNIGATAKPYFPTTDRLDVPRIDYTGAGCAKLLLEPQRTNQYPYSEDLTQWLTVGTPTITGNDSTSPDGTTNADRVQFSGSGDLVYNTGTGSAGTNVLTVYAKAKTGTAQKFRFFANGATLISSDFTATDQWQRFEFVYTYSAQTSGLQGASTGASDVLFWAFQHEVSSYATSYIPTLASSVTRLADTASKTGISSLIGQTEGVVFVEYEQKLVSQSATRRVFALNDGTTSNRITIYINTGNKIEFYVRNSGGDLFLDAAATAGNTTGIHKIAAAYKNGDYAVYMDGVQIISGAGTAGTIPTCSRFDVGNQLGANDLFEPIQSAILFPTRLTNDQLADLTGGNKTTFNALAEFYGYQIL